MSAEDILEQISDVIDDGTMIPVVKVYEIRNIISSEAKEVPFATPRGRTV